MDDDAETRRIIAASVLTDQVQALRALGFGQFHFYTLNQANLTYAACRIMGIRPERNCHEFYPRPTYRLAEEEAKKRILLLDGLWGVMIQGYKLGEGDFRGARFDNHTDDLKGNNDILTLTRPDIIREIGHAYLDAGVDFLETNTFASTESSQADYGLEHLVGELNEAGARLTREICDAASTPSRPRLVAGILGPTNRSAGISPDVNDPGFRNITFDQLRRTYKEATLGLIRGGSDVIMIETIFDTLNAKAAIFAIKEAFAETGEVLPIWISGTITDLSGRTLTGQTPEAFWHSICHADPFAIGLNCALGAKELRPYVAELSAVCDTLVSAHPNAGLPNEFGGYDDTPEHMGALIEEFARSGLVNIVGGCCGTRPEHIARFGEVVRGVTPRAIPEKPKYLRLSGLEPFTLTPETNFVNVGERTNVTGSAKFNKLIKANDYEAALGRRPPAGGKWRADYRRQHGRRHAGFRSGHGALSEPDRGRAGHRPRAGHDRQLNGQ